MIKHVTEKETQLTNMLHACSETLKQVTAERDKLAAELKALRDNKVALPDHDHYLSCDNGRIKVNVYFKDTLTRYGDRRAMAERERCAKVCAGLWRIDGQFTADEFAEAIRKGEKL